MYICDWTIRQSDWRNCGSYVGLIVENGATLSVEKLVTRKQ